MIERDVRVCHVITRLELGGAQDNTLYTVTHLRPPFRPSLICGPGGYLDAEARALPGVEVAFVPSLVPPIRLWQDLLTVKRLARLMRRDRPLIVHTHSSKAGIVGRIAARLARVPIVVHSVHGFGFNREQPAALRALLVAAERAVAPLTTHFIVVSRANLEEGYARGIIPRGRSSLIRSGIRLAEFEEAGARRVGYREALRGEIGRPSGTPVVGMIACLKRQKAPLDFVEMAGRVAREYPQASFVLVGDGELRGAVTERAASLGLSDRIHLLGWRRDVPRLLAGLDVMVLTSSWEGLPRVLPEAIATGVPIVATAVDGTTDILEDGENALVCPVHDPEGSASAVVRLLKEPGLGSRLAARARTVLGQFDIDGMVRAQEVLYRRLLEGRRGREASGVAVGRAGLQAPRENTNMIRPRSGGSGV